MRAKGTLFLNRTSGAKSALRDAVALTADAARDAGLEVIEIAPTFDVTAAVRERIRRGVSLFVAAGGDGTVHHVVQGVVQTAASLAVIPLGTYNHFARDLGIPLDWSAAIDVALAGHSVQIDTGRVNDRFFVNNVSLGLYPELVARREERGRDYPRWKARMHALYATARKYRHVTLVVEAEQRHELIETHIFVVSNNAYEMNTLGLEASRSDLTRGLLSVYWIPHTPRWTLARVAARYLAGRITTFPGFRSFRTTNVRVQSFHRALAVGIDGELFTMATPLVITTMPRSLVVRVPAA